MVSGFALDGFLDVGAKLVAECGVGIDLGSTMFQIGPWAVGKFTAGPLEVGEQRCLG